MTAALPAALPADWEERVYAGVLGKILGVYLGRPVEGWPYERIVEEFGTLDYYVNARLGIPIVTADDDISGSLGFARAILDHRDALPLRAEQVGETWLDYIVEDRTILWWGGLGRSTEHTAFLRLRDGVRAPASGSFALNGTTLPVQVGAQIFVDGIAMAHPADPDAAAAAARSAASVSHDGMALDAAAFIAAMEAAAFLEPDLERLIEACIGELHDPALRAVADDVIALCARERDWRAVRAIIDERYGYHRYVGPCSVVTNHAGVLMALLLGGDDFSRAISIASSAGWDTDSNAGVVGALTGIRLGLDALSVVTDLRTPVADRLLVVTSDGGECVTDAVRETRAIVRSARATRGETLPDPGPRFDFGFRGARQGFEPCPVRRGDGALRVAGARPGGGLVLIADGVGPGVPAAVSTPTFLDDPGAGDHFSTLASPTLYPGQVVRVHATSSVAAQLVPYVVVGSGDDATVVTGAPHSLAAGATPLRWRVPETGPRPITRFGLAVEPVGGSRARVDGEIIVHDVDWSGAPIAHASSGVLLADIWDLRPASMRGWVSSARHFEADFRVSYSVSHPSGRGLATIGSRDWDDYAFASTLVFNPHGTGGLVARAQGHGRYLAAEFSEWSTVRLVRVEHHRRTVLAEAPFAYAEDVPLRAELRCAGAQLELLVDETRILSASDGVHTRGGAGFLVEDGTVLADGYDIRALPGSATFLQEDDA